jgi:hypothetical protein
MHPDIESRLLVYGLHLRGLSRLSDEEAGTLQAGENTTVLLVGNIGSSYWPLFSTSPEYQDGLPDSLDRWSKRVAENLANEFGARAIYPFEGPPYLPFQQWANRAESLSQSPLGLMIHPRYGLWHSYRFGLLVSDTRDLVQAAARVQSPCESCADQPCLNSCPVGAFSPGGYDVAACATYLISTPEAPCHGKGCLARLACPVGVSYQYQPAQHSFHLRAFLAAR